MSVVPHRTPPGPVTPTAVGRRPRDWMVRQLPDQMVADKDSFFVRFVELFQALGDQLLEHADNVEHLADLSVTPEPLIEWLGSWVGAESLDPSVPEQLRRDFTAQAARGLGWRGTAIGLGEYLTVLAGRPVRIEDPSGGVRRVMPKDPWPERVGPPVVRVVVPVDGRFARTSPGSGPALEKSAGPTETTIPLDVLISLVRAEIPAHVVVDVVLGTEVVWSSDEEDSW